MKTRRTYTPIRIDFTPFVDVAFLIITFFMLIQTENRLNQMRIELPDDLPSADASLFLLEGNRIGFLTYRPDGSGAEFLETDYSTEGLRKQLMYIMPDSKSIVLITPTKESTFRNIVDLLDELQINGQIRSRLNYEITPGENRMLREYERYKATNPKSPVSLYVELYPKMIIDA